MNVEIQAPIDQNLWRGFFHHLTIPLRGERNALQLQRPLRPAKTRHVVWVGIPAGDGSIRENSFIHVRVCFKDLELFNDHCSPFQSVSEHVVKDLEARLGSSFIEYDSNGVVFIHQSVLMMLFAVHISSATVDFCNWKLDEQNLIHTVQNSSCDEVLVYVSDTSCDTSGLVRRLYDTTDYLEAVMGNMRVYPSKTELSWCRNKVGDVRVMDDIAAKLQTWRPRTCFGRGHCALRDVESGLMVLKRSYSCAGVHVHVVPVTQRGKLLCTAPTQDRVARRTKPTKRAQRSGVREQGIFYFHQEFIPTFRKIGEFRVMVCGGQVLAAFRTKEDWDARAKPMALRQLQLSDFNWHSQDDETARKQKRDELLDFVLETDTQIRQLKGERFETVHVGARYDCGISPDGHFFVSELTRFTFADTFSGVGAPYDQIIGPLARMIARVLLA
ncbi:hypothetical protein HRG_011249 [Hirsutella rhossiliensis]|uniref:Uncharacterized protein n=1 Tax=Hirsutella rhossiliensis TaxID=111463 RepID=A0A9P8MLZ8_9HYPO|nr:uncharacterized protein HRG_11249 [Hirsutella rhossiliensis]KAH0957758.1 hypothetical protein HRG_11249 [Hirsutella rhossiliensis]